MFVVIDDGILRIKLSDARPTKERHRYEKLKEVPFPEDAVFRKGDHVWIRGPEWLDNYNFRNPWYGVEFVVTTYLEHSLNTATVNYYEGICVGKPVKSKANCQLGEYTTSSTSELWPMDLGYVQGYETIWLDSSSG